jgi:uncharacterized delta-60 repeat protein
MDLSRSSIHGQQARSTARTLLVPLVLLLGFLAFPSAALGAGALDPTFDGDGKVVADLGGNDSASDVVVQSDGKFVTVGRSGGELTPDDFALTRHNVDGSLDTSFGGDGKVLTDFGTESDSASGVAIQSNGKIVAAGTNGGDFALARYDPNGDLDPTFDGDGKVVTDFGDSFDQAYDVAIQSDGKIIAVGNSDRLPNGERDFGNFGLARYNADGSLDAGFDGDGLVVTDFAGGDYGAGVAIQPDGKIVVGGGTCVCDYYYPGYYLALARYNPDGSLDPAFGENGKVIGCPRSGSECVAGAEASGYGVAIQSNGKIVAAGSSWYDCFNSQYCYDPTSDFALWRYNADGTADTSFDGDGSLQTDFGGGYDTAYGVAIQGDGKIVAAGRTDIGGDFDFALTRYLSDGSLDPNFHFDGRVVTDFGGSDRARAVAIGSGGRIVAAGVTELAGSNDGDFALARYTSTGTTLPKLSINDVTRFEGNAGLTNFAFTVSLSTASSQTITVSRQTANGSASAPSDYTALAPATISFAPGETTKTVVVRVRSELAIESNEGFFLKLSNPTGATIADGQGKGTIQNDDLSAAASCTITGTSQGEVLNGTAGNDVICGGDGDDRIFGLDGNDVLKGEGGDDLLVGDNGYDLLMGGSGADEGRGRSGNDTLRGGDQGDTLLGGPNSDALFGDIGADSLNTQDTVSANDRADGGADSDSCTVDSGDIVASCP